MPANRVQISVWMMDSFVKLVDEVATLTGSTRSDLIRRALEHYIWELKRTSIIEDIKGRELK